MDEVRYSNTAPWPSAADGIGPSLQRRVETAYGNDPANWVAVRSSAGLPYVPGGTPPSITTQPVSVTAVKTLSASFSVQVAGTAPFSYQWKLNGTALPLDPNIYGANTPQLTLSNLQPSQAGSYNVVIFNSVSSVESDGAQLTVLIPAKINQQPVGRTVRIRPKLQNCSRVNVFQ